MRSFKNKTVLITAGPTFEPIDPVRFIGNRSSGKMGFSLAEVLANRGAKVVLVSGPVHLTINHPNILRVDVQTAQEMYETCHQHFESCSIAILSAAVADYTVAKPAQQKIKKKGDELSLTLVRTKDILKSLGAIKQKHQTLVGFALETNNEQENALQKLKAKNLDFIVLNSLNDKGAGFQHTTNKITIIDKYNKITNFKLKSKLEVAEDIADYLMTLPQNDKE